MLIFSISLSLGPVGLVSSVPIILPLSLVGTGMGLIKSGTNIGASLFDITTGLIQDADPNKGYKGVIVFFIMIAALAIVAGIVLCILDYSIYDRLLDRSAREAIKAQEGGEDDIEYSKLNDHRRPNANSSRLKELKANWFYGGLYLVLAASSWILFAKFMLF